MHNRDVLDMKSVDHDVAYIKVVLVVGDGKYVSSEVGRLHATSENDHERCLCVEHDHA